MKLIFRYTKDLRNAVPFDNKHKMLYCYVLSIMVTSLSIFLMPIVNGFKNETKIPMYIVGAIFWIALISTVRMAIRINSSRRKNSAFNSKYGDLKKLALIHFFQNKKALIMDAIMFASLIAFIITSLITDNLIIQFLFVSMFAFSFGMHCMLNGINYIYIKHKSTVRRD